MKKKNQPCSTASGEKRLGSYLVEAGLLTQVQVRVALADQQTIGLLFGDVLVLQGWIKKQTIEYFMQNLVLPEREVAVKSANGSFSPSLQGPDSELKVVACCKEKRIVKSFSRPRSLAGLNG